MIKPFKCPDCLVSGIKPCSWQCRCIAVDCPVEVPTWLMGLCGFLGDLSCA